MPQLQGHVFLANICSNAICYRKPTCSALQLLLWGHTAAAVIVTAATETHSAAHHDPEALLHVALGAEGFGCRANIIPTPPATAAAEDQ
jgi:hypothetical protein